MSLRLAIDGVSKSFGNIAALKGVSFDILAGEVHVLAGENGAGKSTLIKILSGVHADYGGELRVDGKRVRFASPREALRAGIATIHQELSLVPSLSIVDNFLLVAGGPAFSLAPRRQLLPMTRAALDVVGLGLDPAARVETLALGDRQLIEIARALGQDARVLVMDEPTSALSEPEVERLFLQIERLRARGVAILYISHRLDEIYRIADRITVLRDGERRLTEQRRALSREELVRAMVGRDLAPLHAARPRQSEAARALLEVQGLGGAATAGLKELSFELYPGEILGLAGLAASGASEALYALFGSAPAEHGKATLNGRAYAPKTPREAMERGVALVPSDRALSVFSDLSVLRNASLSSLRRFSRLTVVDRSRERTAVRDRSQRVALKAPSLEAAASQLSGGNQQKLALLRCLLIEPRLLLLDDPTRGVDVGARAEIYALLAELARDGVGIALRSTDLDELCQVCDRVLVLFRGRVLATLERSELSRERLAPKVMGAAS